MDVSNIKQDLNWRKIAGISLALSLVVIVSSAAFVYTQIDVENQKTSFSVNATVLTQEQNETLEAGIATGQDLSFGRFNAVFNKTKTLNLSSNSLTLAKISSEGNISNTLHYEERKLFEGTTQIPIEMSANKSGYYEGTVNLDLKTAQNKWGERWLRLLYKYF